MKEFLRTPDQTRVVKMKVFVTSTRETSDGIEVSYDEDYASICTADILCGA